MEYSHPQCQSLAGSNRARIAGHPERREDLIDIGGVTRVTDPSRSAGHNRIRRKRGTNPMTTTTLADLAATSLDAIRVLELHGLDYCCGGKQPFEQACRTKGLDPES